MDGNRNSRKMGLTLLILVAHCYRQTLLMGVARTNLFGRSRNEFGGTVLRSDSIFPSVRRSAGGMLSINLFESVNVVSTFAKRWR